jgi:hypothetical protein
MAPEGADPWLHARMTGQELLKYRSLLCWETVGKADLFPDHFVYVSVPNLGIADGSIFRITEKWGRLDARSGEYVNRFYGVVE